MFCFPPNVTVYTRSMPAGPTLSLIGKNGKMKDRCEHMPAGRRGSSSRPPSDSGRQLKGL